MEDFIAAGLIVIAGLVGFAAGVAWAHRQLKTAMKKALLKRMKKSKGDSEE